MDDARIIDGCPAEVEAEVEKYAEEHDALLERTHKPGEQAFEKFLLSTSIQRQAYYSGAYVGNHVRMPSSRSTPSSTSSTAASTACMGG